jgi:hypothetical protein
LLFTSGVNCPLAAPLFLAACAARAAAAFRWALVVRRMLLSVRFDVE